MDELVRAPPCVHYLAVCNLSPMKVLHSVDPNQAQNRVPLQTELETLRNIRSENRQLVDITKRQLEQAKTAHEHYLTTLQQHLTLLQAEDDRLAGLLHPIRRCPEDVLRLIFEAVVDPSRPFEMATTLSHVCRSWRAIALNTVSLWNNVSVSIGEVTEDLKSFIQRTKTRVQSTPLKELTIRVMQRYSPEIMEAFIKRLGLKDFTKIAHATIVLKKSAYVTLVPHLISHFPPSSLDSIRIRAATEFFPPPSWDCSSLFKAFPSLTALAMTKLGSVTLGDTGVLPRLRDLQLIQVSIPSLTMQFNRLVALQRLEIIKDDIDFEPLEQDITFPVLEELEIFNLGFPWDRITAPKLWKVAAGISHTILSFFLRHPTITHLQYLKWVDDNEFDIIAEALVNLEYLDIRCRLIRFCRPLKFNPPLFPFQKLKHLVVEDIKYCRVTLEDFEELIRSRCQIQRSDGKGDLVMLENLDITAYVEDLDSLSWRKSSLLTQARQTVIPEDDESGYTVKIRWLK